MKIKIIITLISLFLYSCGIVPEGSYWKFYLMNGNMVVYSESEWTCYQEKSEDSLYVECFNRLSGDMDSFCAIRAEYEKEGINE